MKILLLAILSVLGYIQHSMADSYLYSATNFRTYRNPNGDEVTSLNMSSIGDTVVISGSGFGNRDLEDSIPEMIYVANDQTGGLWTIYRGQYDNNGPHYFGLQSWTDTEISMTVPVGFGSRLGSLIRLRTYSDVNDHEGTSIQGDLIHVIPEPHVLSILPVIALSALLTKRKKW